MTTSRRSLLVGAAGFLASHAAAKTTTRSTRTPVDPRALRIQPGPARTGKLVLVDVTAPPGAVPVSGLRGTLGGRSGTVCPLGSGRQPWRLLVPVEIEEAARTLPLVLDVQRADGTTTTATRAVRVQPGRYDRRSIRVGREFTSPSPEQLQRAAAENEQLAAVLRQSSPVRFWRGRFVRPTPGPETAPFGTLRTYNGKRRSRHLGLDLDGAVGDPIVASNRGCVVLAAERFYSGGTVVLDHGEGLFTLYFHMSRIDVVRGQSVERSTPLGAVGASGQVTGPHLHFTVKLGGCSVDPSQLLALDLSSDAEATTPLPTSPPTPMGMPPGPAPLEPSPRFDTSP